MTGKDNAAYEQRVNDRFDVLTTIADGWNGPDSKRPDPAIMATVKAWLLSDVAGFLRWPYIYPTIELGGLSIEWQTGQGDTSVCIEPSDDGGFWILCLGAEGSELEISAEKLDAVALHRVTAWLREQDTVNEAPPMAAQ